MNDAFENRVFDQIMVELAKIVGAPNWLTSPTLEEGVPGQAITLPLNITKIFAQPSSTDPQAPAAPTTTHHWRSTFNIWICARQQRDVLNVKADVLRAIYAAESTFTTMFQVIPFPASFTFNNSMTVGGVWIGLQQIQVEYETTHTDP